MRLAAGKSWSDNNLVFPTRQGTLQDAGNVRRHLRKALAGIDGLNPAEWTPESCTIPSHPCFPNMA